MKLNQIDKELLEDYSVDKENKKKYIHKEKKIKESFSLEDLIDEDILKKLRGFE